MAQLTLTRPDDWHIHLRDADQLQQSVKDVARYFGRAIVMPNLTPPVTTVAMAGEYRERILSHRPEGSGFEPLMTLYLTDNTSAEEVKNVAESSFVHAFKLYPAGATTNSDAGVTALEKVFPAIEAMEKHGVPLLLHGEVTADEIDVFDREKVFIHEQLSVIVEKFPSLKVVLEHITTGDAVEFVSNAREGVAATITPHHLLYNRNHILVGGIKPHYYCLPVLKRNTHQEALVEAAISGDPRFFLGTDSAPHTRSKKESACGCAGIYSAHAAIELYAEVFDERDALGMLEGFASHFGPDFYGLPRNSDTIKLEKTAQQIPAKLPFGDAELIPLRGGETVAWRVVD